MVAVELDSPLLAGHSAAARPPYCSFFREQILLTWETPNAKVFLLVYVKSTLMNDSGKHTTAS